MKKLTYDGFIIRANLEHGDLYDYSKFVYENSTTKGIIICKKHGEFLQISNNHLNGSGCPRCKFENLAQCQPRSNSNFITEAIKVHGDVYSYDCSDYKGIRHNINIKCKLHGIFPQLANNHLAGHGCPKCSIADSIDRQTYTTEEFISRAKLIHSKYDYSKVNYTRYNTPVEIICVNHGSFSQTPENHLLGHGCKKCKFIISKPEIEFLEYLNIPNSPKNRQFRIGRNLVDGYDQITNTIYEFLGDYWHGNPTKYKPHDIHPIIKVTYGELYSKTIDKLTRLKLLGYNVKYIWENDWKKFKIGMDNIPCIVTH